MKQIPLNSKFLLALAPWAMSSFAQKTETRPNILYIMSDDHAVSAISAYKQMPGLLAPTPNIDRIAKEGMRFDNVFVTNSISGPSRASILTGKYSHINGFNKNEGGGAFNGEQVTFPKVLHANGYQTALIGKWHLFSTPTGFDYYKFLTENGQQGSYWNPLYNEMGKEVREQGYEVDITASNVIEWLKNRDTTKPFCMLFQTKAPHRPWEPNTKFKDLYKDIDFPVPSNFYDEFKGRENTAGKATMQMDNLNRRDLKLTPPQGLSDDELSLWYNYGENPGDKLELAPGLTSKENKKMKFESFVKDYLRCVASVDENVGRVLDYLDKAGLTENTIVIYCADQSFYLGEHGWFDKRFMYEQSMRMPLLIRYPKKIKKGSVSKDMVLNIDFAPTLYELAGIKNPDPEVQGKSIVPLMCGETPKDWRKSVYYHYYEYPKWHTVLPHYGVRTERYKLIHFYYKADIWELYDLKTDPTEVNNLYANVKYGKLVDSLKTEIVRLQKECKLPSDPKEWEKVTEKMVKQYDIIGVDYH